MGKNHVAPGPTLTKSRVGKSARYCLFFVSKHDKTSVADPDPGSGAFLTPRSRIRNRFFPDPGSQTLIFESLVKFVWVKSSIILWKLAQNFFFRIKQKNFSSILWNMWLQKKGMTKIFFTPLFCCCFWIQDPRSGMGKNQDPGSVINIPGSATLDKWIQVSCKTGEHEGG